MGRLERFDRAVGRAYAFVGTLVGVIIGLFAVAISLDLGLRLFALGSLPGLQEIVEYLLFAGVFLGAPWVLRLNAHVRVDLVAAALPRQGAQALERIIDAVALFTCGALAWYGARNMLTAFAQKATQKQYYVVYEWALLAVLVLSFVLLAMEFALRFLRAGGPTPGRREAGGF